jgi:hypothetical protein
MLARPLIAFLGIAAGLLFGTGGTVAVAIGISLGAVAVGLATAFAAAAWRTTHALGAWFGVKRLGWNWRWTTQRFEESRTRRGLRTPDERQAAACDGRSDV